MSREEFLRRCGNAWDAGLCEPQTLQLLEQWLDFVMRFEGGQIGHVANFLERERIRTHHFASNHLLANDVEGYKLIKLAAILGHPCQACAEDPNAWWTRAAFCEHKKESPKCSG